MSDGMRSIIYVLLLLLLLCSLWEQSWLRWSLRLLLIIYYLLLNILKNFKEIMHLHTVRLSKKKQLMIIKYNNFMN